MNFNATILMLPGLGNSGEGHWQTKWERQYPQFIRVNQLDWETPRCSDWTETLDQKIFELKAKEVILIGHSLACTTIACWAERYKRSIKGALLVAPSDTEAATYPSGTTGFVPVPTSKLPFASIVVTSSDDEYVTLERARLFAKHWGSELVNVGAAGHINVSAGFGDWPVGLELLKRLDN